MNYGYGAFCLYWNESIKDILAERLCELLKEFGFKNVDGYSSGSFPYIEVDGDYGGSRTSQQERNRARKPEKNGF